MLRPVLLAGIAGLALCATTVTASAQAVVVREEVVYIGDVDRHSDYGAEVILDRIERAARHVCTERAGVSPRVVPSEREACRVDATEDAVADVGSAIVTARYRGVSPEVIVSEGDADDPYGKKS